MCKLDDFSSLFYLFFLQDFVAILQLTYLLNYIFIKHIPDPP